MANKNRTIDTTLLYRQLQGNYMLILLIWITVPFTIQLLYFLYEENYSLEHLLFVINPLCRRCLCRISVCVNCPEGDPGKNAYPTTCFFSCATCAKYGFIRYSDFSRSTARSESGFFLSDT